MFTLKHISIRGEERLYRADSVHFTPGVETAHCRSISTFKFINDGVEESLAGGTIFAMNENGKTVARYDLGASPVPIFGDGLSDHRPKGLVATEHHTELSA